MTIKQFMNRSLEVYELTNKTGSSSFKVVPERGGIVTELRLNGEDLLYLNEETLLNKDANVRGGIPILFPISGQLDNGEYEWNDKIYQMKNHGVARNNPWEVMKTSDTENDLSITLRLQSTEKTKKSYPFDFEVVFKYVLEGDEFTIKQEYRHLSGGEPMPFYAGFHPYFKSTTSVCNVNTDAKTYLDYNDMQEKPYEGAIDLTGKKEAVVLIDGRRSSVDFTLPDVKNRVKLDYGDEFKYVVLWAEEGQDFVCIEPWMAKNKALNEKKELFYLPSGESLRTFMSISSNK